MSQRETMVAALTRTVVPLLRARGFTGSVPHFRRVEAGKMHLLTFQFDRYGGGFVINLAELPAGDLTKKWGVVVPQRKLTAYNVNRPHRKRLTPGDERTGRERSWFRYDGDATVEETAALVVTFLPQIDGWFGGEKTQRNIH